MLSDIDCIQLSFLSDCPGEIKLPFQLVLPFIEETFFIPALLSSLNASTEVATGGARTRRILRAPRLTKTRYAAGRKTPVKKEGGLHDI